MRNMRQIVMMLFVVMLAAAWLAQAAPAAKGGPQTKCPVMGGAVDKSVYLDYEGKRIYFCCAQCRQDFQKDPAKYLKKLEDQGVTLEKAPAAP